MTSKLGVFPHIEYCPHRHLRIVIPPEHGGFVDTPRPPALAVHGVQPGRSGALCQPLGRPGLGPAGAGRHGRQPALPRIGQRPADLLPPLQRRPLVGVERAARTPEHREGDPDPGDQGHHATGPEAPRPGLVTLRGRRLGQRAAAADPPVRHGPRAHAHRELAGLHHLPRPPGTHPPHEPEPRRVPRVAAPRVRR